MRLSRGTLCPLLTMWLGISSIASYISNRETMHSNISDRSGSAFPGSASDAVEYVTKEGFEKLRTELEHLKTSERLLIAERLEYAKSLGDLSENAEFDAAKEEQMLNEMRIRELEDLLSRASIIEKKARRAVSTVAIGSTIVVSVHTARATAEEHYTVVGSSEEANPLEGYISHESPLGRAFLGKKKGDTVKAATPKGETEYVIVDVA